MLTNLLSKSNWRPAVSPEDLRRMATGPVDALASLSVLWLASIDSTTPTLNF